ncbi:hypothetical protein BCR43DRAFT_498445 [Syncephalastrum racemosum]|uniref:Uncharacterized protein n=1 Tax=Syncephalastrum racemosum TaxID=13706 RepID=A0A1X2H0X6_SYNRA|nr:hypothetical protein BCR43DRAFT_498445 [Syncephalastrum racemosum]
MTTKLAGQKRKRATRTVRFHPGSPEILETYSADEYDRGGRFQHTTLYKFKAPKELSLAIPAEPFSCHGSDDDLSSSSSNETSSPGTPTLAQGEDDSNDLLLNKSSPNPCTTTTTTTTSLAPKKMRPKLSVDTTICAGPLFFTKLSTHHKASHSTHDDGYLVPVSAYP